MFNKFFFSILFLVTILLVTGCQPAPKALPFIDPELSRVWPPPPLMPRVKLLRTFRGDMDFLDEPKTQKGRLLHWLTGDMAESTPMATPYGVAADGNGRIWVTDPGLSSVHFFDLNKRKSELWTMAGDMRFSSPAGVFFDVELNQLYVADTVNNKVVVLNESGDFLRSIEPRDGFNRPAGLAQDQKGNLLVAEVLGGVIRRFSPAGNELSPLKNPLSQSGLFHRPIGLAVDAGGLIYVIDSFNFQIVVLSGSGEHVATIGKLGDQPGTLSRPRGVAVDSQRHIYISDAAFDNIQVFNLKGELLLVFGAGGENGLSLPAGLYADKQDRIYAVDSFNHRIQIYQYLGGGE